MPKKIPTPAEMKAAVEAFKSKFTQGFYHGSPSPSIKAFDPYHEASELGSATMEGGKAANATFLTRDPKFASSFLPTGNAYGYKPGSTMYPVSANLGKHFDYETPEGLQVIKEYLAKTHPVPKKEEDLTQWMRDRGTTQRDLKEGSWAAIEDPAFQQHLLDTGHDSFALQEAGRKNVGIFNPANIRGKFAEYNPAEAANPDFMKAAGGSIQHFDGSIIRAHGQRDGCTRRAGRHFGTRTQHIHRLSNPTATWKLSIGSNCCAPGRWRHYRITISLQG